MSVAISELLYTANASQAIKATNDYANAQDKLSSKTNKFAASANTGRIAQMNFSRVVQDAPFGFIAIQNNIDPLVHSFQQLRAETGSNKLAMKAFLSSFMGAGGFLAVVNIAVSLFTAFTLASQRSKKSTDKLTQSTKNFREEVEKLKKSQSTGSLISQENQIKGQLKYYKELIATIDSSREEFTRVIKGEVVTSLLPLSDKDREKRQNALAEIKTLNAELQKVSGARVILQEQVRKILAGQVDLSSITLINDAVSALNQEFENVRTASERSKIQTEITRLEDLADGYRKAAKSVKEYYEAVNLGGFMGVQLADTSRLQIPKELQPATSGRVIDTESQIQAARETFQAYLQEGTKFRLQFGTAFQQTLAQYGTLAFDKIFGHGNGLIAIFARNFFNQFVGGITSYFTGGLFNFLGFPVTNTKGSSSRPTNIYIGSELVAEYVDGRVRQKQERFERRSV